MGGLTFRGGQNPIGPHRELGDTAEDTDTRVVRHYRIARDQHVLHWLDVQLHLQKVLATSLLHQGPLIGSHEASVLAGKGEHIRADALEIDEVVLALDIPDTAIS
jgi:hypothetical protein